MRNCPDYSIRKRKANKTVNKMKTKIIHRSIIGAICIPLMFAACKIQAPYQKDVNTSIPDAFAETHDSINSSQIKWNEYFNDSHLTSLIDTALSNNQELNIMLMSIEMERNEVRVRKGEYLPFVSVNAGTGVEKSRQIHKSRC